MVGTAINSGRDYRGSVAPVGTDENNYQRDKRKKLGLLKIILDGEDGFVFNRG
jgi:hypothetical protein